MALWEVIPKSGVLLGREHTFALADLALNSCLGGRLEALRGRSVVLHGLEPLAAAVTLLELDGVARRMVLCPPGLLPEHLPQVIREAGADAWVGGGDLEPPEGARFPVSIKADCVPRNCKVERRTSCETEWVLLTSGTTGAPKLVEHTLATLTSAFLGRGGRERGPEPVVWSTFYDIRRYGGLQIYLRALFGGSLVLADAIEGTAEFLARAARAGVTHISGTPSHWRKALMSGATSRFSPRYVRSSGEIADQAVLDALQAAFPRATVAHAFASTEAGVAFEVRDGLAGFPVSLVGRSDRGVDVDVTRGTLRIRSTGNALRYLGESPPPLKDTEGYVDTGDNLELREGRYYFVGRSGGIINVGGQKVYPEEVEAVINTHPAVRMSLVKARRNPITGAVVAADVMLAEAVGQAGERPAGERIREEILAVCRSALPPHKVPALIRFVPALELSASGKLVRPT
jgi:acyl-coenzyme A synthetase/AMP-(fatty) acid ligase